MSVEALARTMSEAEFADWQTYAARRMLPWRRMELLLAQVALTVARSVGAKDLSMADFLFDPQPPAPPPGAVVEEASAQEAAEFFDFNPVKKGSA
jgi:hypothetical protein